MKKISSKNMRRPLPIKNDLQPLLISVFKTNMSGTAPLCPPYSCRFDFLGWKAQHGSGR
jgi:hypothetical protein